VKRLSFLLLLGALGGGCGSSSGTPVPSRSTAASPAAEIVERISIAEREFRLTPRAVTVSKPGTYVLRGVNRGTTMHGLAVEGNGVDVASTPVPPGRTTTLKVTLTQPGTYELYCPVDAHADEGMRGTLTLLAPGRKQPPATTTAPSAAGGGY
jgi:plastocyanin